MVSSCHRDENGYSNRKVDETLSNETDVPGVAPPDLGDIMIWVYRYKNSNVTEYSDSGFQQQLRSYHGNMLGQAKSVDEESFRKHGITHAAGLALLSPSI